MDDSELDAIRQARLQELKGGQGGSQSQEQQGQDAQKQREQEEEMRASMMSQILTTEARERLSRIRIVRGDRAQGVEDMLIRMARSGQIRQKISEQELVSLLDQISQQESKSAKTKVIFDRRDVVEDSNSKDDDDSEDDFFD